MHTVLIVDDHDVVRIGLHRLIEQDGFYKIIGELDSAQGVIKRYESLQPELVIMDITLPDGDGLTVCEELVYKYPEAKIIILSYHESVAIAESAIKSGAMGYVTKASAGNDILSAMSSVISGGRWLSPDISTKIALSKIAETEDVKDILTQREFDIFIRYAEGKSRHDISRELHISEKTVSNRLSLIKEKLGVSSIAEFVYMAQKYGYL